MKVILVMVQSVNGLVTEGDNPRVFDWTSSEDQQYFSDLIQKNNLLVMGAGTYEAAKKTMSHQEGKLRVILTHHPEKYASEQILSQLEFSSKNPSDLVKDLESRGYSQMLLLGGPTINSLFFRENLIDELWLTVEPKIFAQGKNLVAQDDLKINLKLISQEKLNDQGTLLLKYQVLR